LEPKYRDQTTCGRRREFLRPEFQVYCTEKVVLYPPKSGKLKIEPLTLSEDVQLPQTVRDMFGRMVLTETTKKVSAKTINVKPLPEAGKPEDFRVRWVLILKLLHLKRL
jgi:hypothetical protein